LVDGLEGVDTRAGGGIGVGLRIAGTAATAAGVGGIGFGRDATTDAVVDTWLDEVLPLAEAGDDWGKMDVVITTTAAGAGAAAMRATGIGFVDIIAVLVLVLILVITTAGVAGDSAASSFAPHDVQNRDCWASLKLHLLQNWPCVDTVRPFDAIALLVVGVLLTLLVRSANFLWRASSSACRAASRSRSCSSIRCFHAGTLMCDDLSCFFFFFFFFFQKHQSQSNNSDFLIFFFVCLFVEDLHSIPNLHLFRGSTSI
jgi:hypothetical protein